MKGVGIFDSLEWVASVEHVVRNLGRRFLNTGADFIFPVDEIAVLLEELWAKYRTLPNQQTPREKHWIILLFKEVAVPYRILFNRYNAMYGNTGSPIAKDHFVRSIIKILDLWKQDALALPHQRVSFATECPNFIQAIEEYVTDLHAGGDDPRILKHELLGALQDLKGQLLSFREHHFA